MPWAIGAAGPCVRPIVSMLQFDTRTMLDGASAPPKPPAATPRVLSPAAQKIAAEPTSHAYSPIVLAGTVRLIEFALVMLVGLAIWLVYAFPIHGFEWQ